jgi:hypothetical protein
MLAVGDCVSAEAGVTRVGIDEQRAICELVGERLAEAPRLALGFEGAIPPAAAHLPRALRARSPLLKVIGVGTA